MPQTDTSTDWQARASVPNLEAAKVTISNASHSASTMMIPGIASRIILPQPVKRLSGRKPHQHFRPLMKTTYRDSMVAMSQSVKTTAMGAPVAQAKVLVPHQQVVERDVDGSADKKNVGTGVEVTLGLQVMLEVFKQNISGETTGQDLEVEGCKMDEFGIVEQQVQQLTSENGPQENYRHSDDPQKDCASQEMNSDHFVVFSAVRLCTQGI